MIALINPRASVEVVERLDISTPPLGLCYLASCLREAGFKVKIIDDLVEKLNFEELIKKIKNAIMVGITSTTPTFNSALNYAKKIKEKLSTFIILGGVHVTFKPYDAMKSYVDAVCIGEGEETIVEVAERVEAGKNLEGVKGIFYREGEKIIENQPRKFIEDLDRIPFPAYDLISLEKYTVLGKRLRSFPMITSRGCPFSCNYCSSSLFMGKKFRARSAKNVVDEIEWLVNDFKARSIAFSDDTFTLNKKRVEEICKEIKNRGLEISWSCSSRVDTVDEDTIKIMKEAGCKAIYFGVESASERILKYYKKRISVEKAFKAVNLAKKYKITTICSFIVGAPDETKEEMEKTLKLAIDLDPNYAQFSVLTPYPGTEIYEEARSKGLLLTENYDEYTAAKPVLSNFYLKPEEISEFLKKCYLKFYLRPKFLFRELRKGNLSVILKVIKKFLK
ncbi:MAG: B12-binding domain-containing radical SAM protein [Archaeoglobaceae archaeon]|nr:B12-binding domain-containing radical SAM protein [Archaeoglobaceae archaeon]MCX8151828.1 B12-binding domain-containing radical SAM protein [Archaeoglobaceae archaeon]MDW8014340.1 radical SAM protein [Archaeoglobaceae archaeon]